MIIFLSHFELTPPSHGFLTLSADPTPPLGAWYSFCTAPYIGHDTLVRLRTPLLTVRCCQTNTYSWRHFYTTTYLEGTFQLTYYMNNPLPYPYPLPPLTGHAPQPVLIPDWFIFGPMALTLCRLETRGRGSAETWCNNCLPDKPSAICKPGIIF